MLHECLLSAFLLPHMIWLLLYVWKPAFWLVLHDPSLLSTVSLAAFQAGSVFREVTLYPVASTWRLQKVSCSWNCLMLSCWRSDFCSEIKTNVVFLLVRCFAVDITLYRNGYHGDLNETFFVGDVDEGARKLVQTTYECLMQAIDAGQCPCWAPAGAAVCCWGLTGSFVHSLSPPAPPLPYPELAWGFSGAGFTGDLGLSWWGGPRDCLSSFISSVIYLPFLWLINEACIGMYSSWLRFAAC